MGTEVKAEAPGRAEMESRNLAAETKPHVQSWELRKDCLSWAQKTEGKTVHPQALGCSLEKVTAGNQNPQSHQSMGLESDQTPRAKACSK